MEVESRVPSRITNGADGDDGGAETFDRETRSIGEAVVSEYLWWRGLDHIDYLLATHADADHIDGLNRRRAQLQSARSVGGANTGSRSRICQFLKHDERAGDSGSTDSEPGMY